MQTSCKLFKTITFNKNLVTSMVKINSNLYVSTWKEGFLEVDLVSNSVNNISSISGSRIAMINNSELAVMQSVSGPIKDVKSRIIDLTIKTFSDKSNGEIYRLFFLAIQCFLFITNLLVT